MNFLKKNSWTIDLKKVPAYVEWNGVWRYAVDRELIRLILECEELDELGNPKITENMKTTFKNNIVDKLKKGVLYIEWSARGGGYGRRYSAKDPNDTDVFSSAGNLGVHSKYIKNTIFHYEGWVDYDMVKGHPTILLNMARHTRLTGGLPAVERYVNEFDSVAEELIDHYSGIGDDEEETKRMRLTKGDIKDLFNRTIYGGGHSKWVEKIRKGDEKKGKIPRPCNDVTHLYYNEFRADIQRVIDLVYNSNPDLVAKVAGDAELSLYKKKNRTMSYFCGILENEILKQAYKYGVTNGLFKERSIDLCFDGFTAPPPPPYTDMEFHISGMNDYIKEKTGFDIVMKVKGFDKVIQSIIDARRATLEATPVEGGMIAEVINDEGIEPVVAVAPTNNDAEYIIWKSNFEKEWCKIKNTATFIRTYEEDGVFKKFVFQDEKKLIIAYKNECYTEVLENGKTKKKIYIKEWLEDPNMLCYEDCGVYPPPLECPTNIFNLWKDSPFEAQPFTGMEDPEIDHDAVQKFVNHIHIMCNRDEVVRDWIISWFAHSIQRPCEKPEHAINLIGGQGTGKSTIVNTFSKLCGLGKTLETSSPERDCWGSFNSAMTNAFIVILSETDKRNAYCADGKIKSLITDYPLLINPKGKDQFPITSYHRVIQLTNTLDPTKTSKDDRRNLIVRCNDELKGNKDYFNELYSALDRPNALRSIYWSLKIYDISGWNFRNVPKTKYHNILIEHSTNPISIFLEAFVLKRIQLDSCVISGTELLQEFREWREGTGYKFEDTMNEGVLLKKLKIECNLPEDAIVRGNRTNKGYKQTFNIRALKKHFGMNCLLLNNEGDYITQDKEVSITEHYVNDNELDEEEEC